MKAAARWLARAADRRSTVDIVSPLARATRRRRYPPDQRGATTATASGPCAPARRQTTPRARSGALHASGHDWITEPLERSKGAQSGKPLAKRVVRSRAGHGPPAAPCLVRRSADASVGAAIAVRSLPLVRRVETVVVAVRVVLVIDNRTRCSVPAHVGLRRLRR